MMRRLDSRWDALSPDATRTVFQLYDATHPLPFYIGRDNDGKRVLLLVCDDALPMLRSMRALKIHVFERADGRKSLVLTLEVNELASIFTLLCEDLIESSRHLSNSKGSIQVVLRRLDGWRTLLSKEVPGLLTDAEVRGLYGELCFLNSILGILGAAQAISAWVGPLNADQDFQLSDRVWEIKTLRPDAEYVHIASERQLLASEKVCELVLVTLVEKVEVSDEALSLNSLISGLRNRLELEFDVLDLFDARLLAAGYMYREEYDRPIFSVLKIETISVSSCFPRLIPSSLPKGVFDVSYKISLECCRTFRKI